MCAYARPRAQVLEVQEHGRAVHTSREGSKNTLRDSLLRFRALAALRTVTRACLAPSLQLHAASHLQPWPRTCAPSPTLSPTDPVPRGLLTLWARGNTYTPNTSTRNTYATPAQAPTQHLHKQHGTASTAHMCARTHTYIYAYTRPALAHRVSRPRGTGSVGDSVGEGAHVRVRRAESTPA